MDKKTQWIHAKILDKVPVDEYNTVFGIEMVLDDEDNTLIIYDRNGNQIDSSHSRYGEVIEAIWEYIKDKDPIDEFLKSIAV